METGNAVAPPKPRKASDMVHGMVMRLGLESERLQEKIDELTTEQEVINRIRSELIDVNDAIRDHVERKEESGTGGQTTMKGLPTEYKGNVDYNPFAK